GRDKNRRRLGRLRLKCLVNMRPQLMNIELGCIQYNVCDSPDRSQSASLAGQRFLHRVIGPEWMRPPRLAITAEQDVILRFQKYQRRVVFASQFSKDCRELLQALAFTDIHYESGIPTLFGLRQQVCKMRNQFDGQVIDRIKTKVLEGLQHRGFSGTTHPSDNDQAS